MTKQLICRPWVKTVRTKGLCGILGMSPTEQSPSSSTRSADGDLCQEKTMVPEDPTLSLRCASYVQLDWTGVTGFHWELCHYMVWQGLWLLGSKVAGPGPDECFISLLSVLLHWWKCCGCSQSGILTVVVQQIFGNLKMAFLSSMIRCQTEAISARKTVDWQVSICSDKIIVMLQYNRSSGDLAAVPETNNLQCYCSLSAGPFWIYRWKMCRCLGWTSAKFMILI